jgi:putative heme-binding domain-containing protein
LSNRLAASLREIVLNALAIAEDPDYSIDDRTRATVIAANAESADVDKLVHELVRPPQPQRVQSAAVWAAAQANSAVVWKSLFDQWPGHTTPTRQAMLDQVLRSKAGIESLVNALEADIISAEELPATTRQVLSQSQDESLRLRVQPILAEVTPADRAEILARYAGVTSRRGDSSRGAGLFKQHCQTCHAMQGVGNKVGPDLASVASRQTDLLIVDILDPSQQVTPDYINYLAVTKQGRVLSGLIAGETSDSITLRREEGQQDTIPRSDIEQLRASGKSIMPDGLEQKLTPDQLADLLEFLHHPDVDLVN